MFKIHHLALKKFKYQAPENRGTAIMENMKKKSIQAWKLVLEEPKNNIKTLKKGH